MNSPYQFHPNNEPSTDSAILIAQKDRVRKTHAFDVSEVLGLDKPMMAHVRVPTKREQDIAIAQAHQYAKSKAEQTGSVATDADVLQDAKSAAIVAMAFRESDAKDALPVWTNCEIISNVCSADQIGALVNMVNEVRFRESKFIPRLSDEQVEAYVKVAGENADTNYPDHLLVQLPSEYIRQMFIMTAVKLTTLRESLKPIEHEFIPDGE